MIKQLTNNCVYNFFIYVWYFHPNKVYYGVLGIVNNLGVAEAAGSETVAQAVGNKLSQKHYLGIKAPCTFWPYANNVESYQHVQMLTSFYKTELPEQGWKYVQLHVNYPKPIAKLPDFIITNGEQVITGQYKAIITGNFYSLHTLEHMKAYAQTCDFIGLSCLQEKVYENATSFTQKLISQGNLHPDLLVTLLNLEGGWDDLSIQQQEGIMYAMDMQRKHLKDEVYNKYNDDIHSWISKKNNVPATCYALPNIQMKLQIIQILKENMLNTGITSKVGVLSELNNNKQLE